MNPNHKLTNVIKGRKVVETSNEDGKTIISFDDGSTMRVKTGASSTRRATGTATASMSDNAATSNVVANPKQQDLMPSQSKRNDVFRNLKWNESAFNDDISRQNAHEHGAHSEVRVGEVQPEVQPVEMKTDAAKVSTNQASTGGTVKSVVQGETTITLFFEDNSRMDFPLQEATSSVMLRAKDNTMEYAD
ncbi:MAG TPA: hypothetical protein VM821_06635 [Abditibacteriaceae bacterium]|nr:hypothetical protein [Abditibacteriaceae bacterium]